MAQAPNWVELEKWEDYFEPAAKAILQANGITSFITRTDETITLPGVCIELQLGEADRHAGKRTSDGELFLDTYRAQLHFDILTDRATNDDQDAANTDSHAQIRAKIRWLMRDVSLWSTALLPYHQVTEIMPAGTSPEVVDEQDRDISRLTFALVVSVRADAWPED